MGADSIWLKTGEEELRSVDKNKLERAEELRIKKQNQKDNTTTTKPASQVLSKSMTAKFLFYQGLSKLAKS